jgi:hypothetical protein
MHRTIITLLVILFFPMLAFTQNKASKKEIYDCWNKEMKKLSKNEIKAKLTPEILLFTENLKRQGVDTIGVYIEEYVGSITSDSCKCGIIPWMSYIHWSKAGTKYFQKITKCCFFDQHEFTYSPIIDYYLNNKLKIDNAIIMPVILSASKNRWGRITKYETESIDHSTQHSIYLDINGHYKYIAFDQFELDNVSNLFYLENNNSIINAWIKHINN